MLVINTGILIEYLVLCHGKWIFRKLKTGIITVTTTKKLLILHSSLIEDNTVFVAHGWNPWWSLLVDISLYNYITSSLQVTVGFVSCLCTVSCPASIGRRN